MPTGTAIFGAAGVTSLTFSASPTSIGTMQFNAAAPAYTFTLNGQELDITGAGITNNSSNAPSFLLIGASSLVFKNSATAANANITVNNGATASFINTSSGGQARLIINAGGTVDISGLTSAGTTAGSIEGAGSLLLGAKALAAGSNNLSTTFSGVISGAGGSLTKTGSGTLILTGTDTYSGGTTISGGTLQLGNGGAAGTIVGNVTDNATFAIDRSDTYSFGGVISGSGAFQQLGSGTTVLNGANTYTGATTISAGTLQTGIVNALSTSTAASVAGGATFNLANNNQSIGSLAGAGGVTLGSATLTTGGDNTSPTFSGVISGAGGSLIKAGSGNQTLSGDNTYTGSTTVNAGTLTLSGNNSYAGGSFLNGGTLSVSADANLGNASGALNFNGGTLQVTGLTFNSTARTINWGAGGGGFDIANAGNNFAVSQVLGPGGALTKTGAGTLTLSGINSYTGTNINGGTLAVSADNNLGGAGGISFNGGTLKYLAGFNTSRLITLNAGGGAFDTNGFNSALGDVVSGAGGLTKNGAGTLTLNATNTYTGVTTVNAGTLLLGVSETTSGLAGGVAGTVDLGANTLTINGASSNTFAGVIQGTGDLVKNGTGTQTLSGINTYSGGTTLNAGTLSVSAEANLGNVSGALNFNGGTLQVTGLAFNSTARTINWGAGGGGFDIANAGNNFTVSQVLGPGGALTKTGAGTLTLSGINTYTGTNINGGTLAVSADNNLGGAGGISFNGGTLKYLAGFNTSRLITLNAGGGTFDTNGFNSALGGVVSGAGGLTKNGAGTLTLNATNTYGGVTTVNAGTLLLGVSETTSGLAGGVGGTVDLGANTLTFNGSGSTSFAGVIQGTGDLVKNGTGTQTLSGINTYSGGTTLNAGTLSVSAEANLGNVTGALSFNGGTLQVTGLTFNSTARTINWGAGGGGFDIANAGNNFAVSQVLGPGGALTKTGAGTLTLSGINSYTGTNINGGTLAVSADNNLGGAGGISFNGGTLKYLAGFNTSRLITLNAGGGTFDTNGFNSALGGVVSGAGGLTKNGAGTLILDANNNYSGATIISNGTLRTGVANALPTSTAVSVAGGAALDLANNNEAIGSLAGAGSVTLGSATLTTGNNNASTTFSGVISGTNGSLAKVGNGTLILSGPNSYTGATTISAGTLRTGVANALAASTAVTVAGGATFDLANNNQSIGSLAGGGNVTLGLATLTTGNDDTSTTFSGAISGSGGLTKAGTGTFTLSGPSTYTGATTVNDGTLLVDGTIVSAAFVNSGAIFGGSGTVTDVTVNNGGTLGAGSASSFGLLIASAAGANNGNITFNNNSFYRVKVAADGQNDLLIASGTATLNGGTVQVLAGAGVYKPQTQYLILNAGSGIITQFAGVTSNLAFLTPSLIYDAHNVFLLLTSTQFTSNTTSPNQSAVGSGLQQASGGNPSPAGNAILTAVSNLSAAAVPAAFNALSGEGTTGTQETSFAAANMFTSATMDQAAFWLRGESVDPNGVTLRGDASPGNAPLPYAASKKRKDPIFKAIKPPPPVYQERTWRAWATAFGGSHSLNGDSSTAGLAHRTAGGAMGLDYQLNPDLLFGLALGTSTSSFSVAERATTGKLDGGHLGIYGAAKFGEAAYALSSLNYGRYANNTTRTIAGIGPTETAMGNFRSDQLTGRIEIGWRQVFNRFAMTPFAALQFTDTWQRPYEETSVTGAGAPGILGLSFGARTASSVPVSLGLHVDGRIVFKNGAVWWPYATLAWTRELERERQLNGALIALPQGPFTIDGAFAALDTLKLKAGSKLALTPGLSLFGSFEGDFSNRGSGYALMGGLNFTGWHRLDGPREKADAAKWTSAFNIESRFSTWSGTRGYPASGSTARGSGWQNYMPITLQTTGIFANDLKLELTAKPGYVWSHQSTPGIAGALATTTDTVASATLTYTGIAGMQPFASLNLNLPTGQSVLLGSAANARMDPDFVELGTFGEGFNIGPTLGVNLPLSETTTVSLGAGMTHRGPYNKEGAIDPITLQQPTQRFKPGDVLTANASIGYQGGPLTLFASASISNETASYTDGSPSFQLGNRYVLSGSAGVAWSESLQSSLSASWSHNNSNKILDPSLVNLTGEAFNSNSDIYRADISHTYTAGQWAFGPTASYMLRSQNSFSPVTYQFVPPKTMISAGAAAKYTINDQWNINGKLEHFRAFEKASPDKLLGGVVVPDSGVPEMRHQGWKATLGGTVTF